MFKVLCYYNVFSDLKFLYRSEKYNSMTILVVGCASKGRTTFVKRLMKDKTMKGSSQSNLLFEMDEWTYSPSSNVSPVTFKIWDFSGKVSK